MPKPLPERLRGRARSEEKQQISWVVCHEVGYSQRASFLGEGEHEDEMGVL